MNAALTVLALLTGQTPDDELELARAAVAVEVAKLALSDPVPAVVSVVTPDQPAPAGYLWQRREGEPWKLVKEVKPAGGPFLPGGWNPTHRCPACGRSEFVIDGPGPVPGSHTHRCRVDGTVWWHK